MTRTETQTQTIDVLIRARYPVLYVVSFEEERVEKAIRKIAEGKKQVLVWTVSRPFQGSNSAQPGAQAYAMANDALEAILRDLKSNQQATIYLLKDFDPYMDDAVITRKLRDVAAQLKRSYSSLVMVSPVLRIPTHLEKEITVVDFDLPGQAELTQILDDLMKRVAGNPSIVVQLDEGAKEAVVKAALGLTEEEASQVFAKALVMNGRLDREDIEIITAEKQQILRKSGLLEFYEADEEFADVGGLDLLKDWLQKRTAAFTERARKFGLPEPRGMLLLGVQGCGKSLSAKAVSALWKLPLLRFDVGAVFGKWVGESEANMRRALQVAESLAPCVLWLDELEKAFGGMSGSSDGGTTKRVFGSFLTWLQDKRSPVFVIGTANDISALPPELLRKGRLDEIFFVDLPAMEERSAIFGIHLKKRNRDVALFDLEALAKESVGFSGAEIEQAVIAALYDAFEANRDITTDDVLRSLRETVPLSRTMREEIAELRTWARDRARWASSGRVDEELGSEPPPAEFPFPMLT